MQPCLRLLGSASAQCSLPRVLPSVCAHNMLWAVVCPGAQSKGVHALHTCTHNMRNRDEKVRFVKIVANHTNHCIRQSIQHYRGPCRHCSAQSPRTCLYPQSSRQLKYSVPSFIDGSSPMIPAICCSLSLILRPNF